MAALWMVNMHYTEPWHHIITDNSWQHDQHNAPLAWQSQNNALPYLKTGSRQGIFLGFARCFTEKERVERLAAFHAARTKGGR